MRKIRILAPIIALLLVLTGCQQLLTSVNAYLYADTYISDKYSEEYRDNWQYKQLTAQQKEYYGSIYTAILDTVNTDIQVEFKNENSDMETVDGVRVRFKNAKMDSDELALLFEAIFRDNPQFFYLNREYRIEGNTVNGETYYDTIILQFLFPLEQRLTAIDEFETALSKMMENIPNSQDQYETELLLYDRLANHCTYDTAAAAKEATEDSMAYTAYGALVEGSAVCEGYAKAMQLLLTKSNIAATSASGISLDSKESHMWNLVTINGANYYLDPTWSDSNDAGSHAYFNITSEMLERTHKLDEERLSLPVCTETTDNYFVRNGTFIDTYKRESIAKVIAKHIVDGHTTIQLQFSPKTFDNGLLFLKNGNLIFEMVNEELDSQGLTLWDFTLWTDKQSFTLTLVKA